MKKTLLTILIILVPFLLGASTLLPSARVSVARAGRLVDVFANPASLPFRSASEGSFLVSLAYSDESDGSLYSSGEPLPFFQSTESSLTLSFGGRNAMFTLAVGHDLEDRTWSAQEGLFYDMYFRMHFQLDLAYSFGPFSFGARFKGGSSLTRSDRPVSSPLDYVTNLYFSQFYENAGSEYFQFGLGLMWYDDWFTIGLYSDRVMGTNDGQVVFSLDSITDTLSLGIRGYLPRFTDEGELRLLRPSLSLQFGDMTGQRSYILVGAQMTFQLLPQTNVSLEASWISYRNARESYLHQTDADTVYTLEFEFGSWAIEADLMIPLGVYKGSPDRPLSFVLALRYSP